MNISMLCLIASFSWMPLPRSDEGTLSDAEFQQLHRQLQASSEVPWRTIPWKISLLDAQRASVSQKKPIFIWAMDGHPLGCT
ncbi:MAG: hypothetical protein CMJ95_00870 [Planctomycetes bacterium]|nr:hypothetical protein [Planctomycetota bacterium]